MTDRAGQVLVSKVRFSDYDESVPRALELIGAAKVLPQSGLVVLKPNLVNESPPPVTTDVRMVEAVLNYCRSHSKAEIVIGEGSGSGTTAQCYRANGYDELARKYDVKLIDLNEAESVLLRRSDALSKKKFYLPKILIDAFVISIPVLKDHSMTRMTGAMKNMFGIAPMRHYKLTWNKSQLHFPSTAKSVVDICLYKKPGLSIVDTSLVLRGSHLSGTAERVDRILAGVDPVAVDAEAAGLLGHEVESIKYLRLANGLVGTCENVKIVADD